MNYLEWKNRILSELDAILTTFSTEQTETLVSELLRIHKQRGMVVGTGAGRMGYSLRSFIMRLNHLGISAYFFGDTYIPPMSKNDLLLIVSASGKTSTILHFLEQAIKKASPFIITVTGDENSPMAALSNHIVKFRSVNGGLNSMDSREKLNSSQPMTTLNEQAILLFFDIVVMHLIEKMNLNREDIYKKHFNLE